MAHKPLVNSTVREIGKGKAMIGGTVREVSHGKALVNGTVYKAGFSTPIGSLPVGTSLYFTVNGVRTEFIVVHQGIPASSQYDASCNGTWVLMKNCHSTAFCGSGNYSNYGWTGNLHSFFNNGFLSELEAGVRDSIKTVSIPYVAGTGEWQYGIGSLSTRVFALSGYETGFAGTDGSLPGLGAVLDYFRTADKRAYFNGALVNWWLRSPVRGQTNMMYVVTTSGGCGALYCDTYTPAGRRPAFILPSDFDATNYV